MGTTSGAWRRSNNGWQAWPDIDGTSPAIRSILVAPDEGGLTAWWVATDQGLLISRDGQSWERRTRSNTPLTDDDILTLHLDQTLNALPEIWIGTGQGLTIWRVGEWENVVARPNGFHGGQVHSIRRLVINGQRQLWVAGKPGVSRHIDGSWQRWGRDCLRGQQVHAIESIDHPAGLRVAVATDRGLTLLDPDDPGLCEVLSLPGREALVIQHLARDRHEQLYLFARGRIDRVHKRRAREGVQTQWTFFDHRDGLPQGLDGIRASMTPGDGSLLVGSDQGLWQMQPADGRERRLESLVVQAGLADRSERVSPGRQIDSSVANPAIALEVGGSSRPHALRVRYHLPDQAYSPWQPVGRLQLQDLAHGRQILMVEVADEFGQIHGPLQFVIQRPRPWGLYFGLVAALLLLTGGILLGVRNLRR